MKWKEILLKALDYIKKHRALWYLGILAVLVGSGGGENFYSFGGSGSNKSSGTPDQFQLTVSQISDWISAHQSEVEILIIAAILICIILLYIAFSARAGLIYAVDGAESHGKKPEFHQSFHQGQKYFWRFVGLSLLIALMIFAVIFVLVGLGAILAILLVSVSAWFLIIIIPVGLLLVAGIIILTVYLNWLLLLAYREIVIEDKKIVAAITAADRLIHHNFSKVILAWLIALAVGLAAGIAIGIVSLVVGGLFFGICVGIYFVGGIAATIIYGAIAGIIFIALALLLAGVLNAYISTYWTLVYRELKK